jgi:hypothetical protein
MKRTIGLLAITTFIFLSCQNSDNDATLRGDIVFSQNTTALKVSSDDWKKGEAFLNDIKSVSHNTPSGINSFAYRLKHTDDLGGSNKANRFFSFDTNLVEEIPDTIRITDADYGNYLYWFSTEAGVFENIDSRGYPIYLKKGEILVNQSKKDEVIVLDRVGSKLTVEATGIDNLPAAVQKVNIYFNVDKSWSLRYDEKDTIRFTPPVEELRYILNVFVDGSPTYANPQIWYPVDWNIKSIVVRAYNDESNNSDFTEYLVPMTTPIHLKQDKQYSFTIDIGRIIECNCPNTDGFVIDWDESLWSEGGSYNF